MNIVLTFQIADFGFSKTISSHPISASSVGSLLYSSPEIIRGEPYQGPECDVWSLGVILYTMLTATMPFDDSNMGQFLVKIENGQYPVPLGVSNSRSYPIAPSRIAFIIWLTQFSLQLSETLSQEC